LFLATSEGIAWHLVRDLHPVEAGPRPILDSMCLSPSGRTLLARVAADPEHAAEARPEAQRLVLIDVATGRQRLTPFVQRGRLQRLYYGIAPNEVDLAVAVGQSTEEGDHVTLSVLRGPDLAVHVKRVFDGAYMAYDVKDAQMQWSPDGRLVALSMLPMGEYRTSVFILDTGTLETVLRVDPPRDAGIFVQMAGSMSWSPDSRRLVIRWDDFQRILHVEDGRLERLEWLKGQRGDPPRQPQILGLLSGDRALTQVQRGTRLRLAGVALATGKGSILADVIVDEDDAYLQMAVSREWDNISPAPRRRKSTRTVNDS